MMRDRLAEAIQLRETGRAKQDQAMLEEARAILLALVATYPDEAEITYQTAIVHDNLGLEREAIPFYVQTLTQGLSGPDTATKLMKRHEPLDKSQGLVPVFTRSSDPIQRNYRTRQWAA